MNMHEKLQLSAGGLISRKMERKEDVQIKIKILS
jgi:hypothetical protein